MQGFRRGDRRGHVGGGGSLKYTSGVNIRVPALKSSEGVLQTSEIGRNVGSVLGIAQLRRTYTAAVAHLGMGRDVPPPQIRAGDIRQVALMLPETRPGLRGPEEEFSGPHALREGRTTKADCSRTSNGARGGCAHKLPSTGPDQ